MNLESVRLEGEEYFPIIYSSRLVWTPAIMNQMNVLKGKAQKENTAQEDYSRTL